MPEPFQRLAEYREVVEIKPGKILFAAGSAKYAALNGATLFTAMQAIFIMSLVVSWLYGGSDWRNIAFGSQL